MSAKYYAVQFWSGRKTTTGQPNEKTGRMSIACDIEVFSSKKDRDNWVENGKTTSDMRGICREVITKKEARDLCLGMSVASFNEMIEMQIDNKVQ